MFYLAIVLVLHSSFAFHNLGRFHKVPFRNGSTLLMSDQEIHQIMLQDDINSTYNPYTDVKFHLYTPSNPFTSQLIQIENPASLHASNFNSTDPTIVLVHGWNNGHHHPFVQDAKNEYLALGNYNVMAVNWDAGANDDYAVVRNRMSSTGEVIGIFIEFLERDGNANIDTFIVAGFSFGGHVVGNVGKRLNGRLPVIFSLDPAQPLFFYDDVDRLAVADARFVEVIHSNTNFWGFRLPIGHADYYPNGGEFQAGCGYDDACAHQRAHRYFIESLRSLVGFVGLACATFESIHAEGCQILPGVTKMMAGEPYSPGNGVFYVATNEAFPFGRG